MNAASGDPGSRAGAGATAGDAIVRTGRALCLAGVVAPLLLIGGMKFTAVEIAALTPMLAATPWLAWLPGLLGAEGASYLIGVVEIATAVLLVASLRWRQAALAGGALATLTFAVTCSLMLALPIFEPTLGFPALGPAGQFLIKDVALLGIALVILGEAVGR